MQVGRRRLAGYRRITPDAQHVVLNLERQPEVLAEIEHGGGRRRVRATYDRAKPARRRDERCRLAADHRQVVGLADAQIALVVQVKELPFADGQNRLVEAADDLQCDLGRDTHLAQPV